MTAAPPIGGPALHALLARVIDYAGLFPPAGLPLPAALANYRTYRDSADSWALGRFVVPAARLPELETVLRASEPSEAPVPLSVVIGPPLVEEVSRLEEFALGPAAGAARIESVEVKVRSGRDVSNVLGDIPSRFIRYLELPAGEASDPVLRFVALSGVSAKVRTGGTAPEDFPAVSALVQFLRAAARWRVPFKATAGLHHPLRGSYRLTDEANAVRSLMYGYLNLSLAAAILWQQGDGASAPAEAALVEAAPGTLSWEGDALRWRDFRFEAGFLAEFRRNFFHGFGSCSFREPLDELAPLVAAR